MKQPYDQIDTVLNSLEGIESAKPSADFDQRLLSRLDVGRSTKFIKWFHYSIAAMIVLAIVNMVTLIYISDEDIINDQSYAEITIEVDTYQYLETFSE